MTALVKFVVKDTGRGIQKDEIPRLFSEYRQLDALANRHIEGTGLGLKIEKNLVSLMNGDITVESEYGTGSVFTVCIPQHISDSTPIGVITARNLEYMRFKDISRSQSLRLARRYMPYGSVLEVDDVETNLDVARGLLLPYGISVYTAGSGREAVEKIRAAGESEKSPRYDLVLMDHMMPGMDGIEAVRIIRNEIPGDYGKTVPIVALTANALAGNREMFLANGFNGYISKPIDIMMLDTALNTWVRNKQSADTLIHAETEAAGIEKEKEPSVLDGLQVEGIDLIQGVERYSSESSYLEILRSWHLHTPALLEILRGLSLQTLPEYTVTVHGLKGSCYGICADGIGEKAEELEQSAKAGDFAHVHAENTAFIESVEQLLQAVGELLQKVAAGKKAKQKARAPDTALLIKLLDAVRRYKSTVMEEVMNELESYEYESGGDLVEWLRGQIDNLEYEAICGKLESVCPEGTDGS
jgi:CheY-like chemotaxis protein